MFFSSIGRIRRQLLKSGITVFSLGKDLLLQGKGVVMETIKPDKQNIESSEKDDETKLKETRRQHLQKQFTVPDPHDQAMEAREESLRHSQGVTDFSGSPYNGADSPGERTNFNKMQRNYDNHQGN